MKELWQELILFLQGAIAPVIGEAKKATGNIFFDIYVLDFLDVPDTVSEYDLQKGRGLLLPLANLFFYKRNTAALFFYFTRIAIIYPLFCCGRDIGLGCRLGRCFCFAEVSTGHPHPSPTTATVKFYKNKEEMYLIRYISSNFIPNRN